MQIVNFTPAIYRVSSLQQMRAWLSICTKGVQGMHIATEVCMLSLVGQEVQGVYFATNIVKGLHMCQI